MSHYDLDLKKKNKKKNRMIQLPPHNLRISQSNFPLESYENFPLPIANYEV